MGDLNYHQDMQGTANLHPDFIFKWEEQETVEVKEKDSCGLAKGAVIEFFEFTLSGDMKKLLEIWSPSQTDTSSVPKTDEILKELKNIDVKVPNQLEIKRYLNRYDDMLDLVIEVCQMTRGCFPPATQLSLEVYHDPEIEDEYLTLYVRQEDYERDILKKIKAILSGYGDRLADKSGWLLVTTDFQPLN